MPGQLYYKGQQIPTPTLGGENARVMYMGDQYVGYDGQYGTFYSASGGTIFDSGSYRYHLYTASGDFTIDVQSLTQNIEVLVVGGGGGGCSLASGSNSPGGGNGGAVVHIPINANFKLDKATYNVVIGTGGQGQEGNPNPNLARPATSGSNSFVSGSDIEIIALGGIFGGATFVSQSSLPGISGQYGHNFIRGTATSYGSPGGGGAGEVGGNAATASCAGGVGGDGYQVDTFPFAADWEFRGNEQWGAGGGGTSFPGAPGCGVFYNGAEGGIAGGGKGKGTTTPINPNEINGDPNTGGGGGANASGGLAGNGAAGFVGFRYRIS
jgi:hypothetical protein